MRRRTADLKCGTEYADLTAARALVSARQVAARLQAAEISVDGPHLAAKQREVRADRFPTGGCIRYTIGPRWSITYRLA